MRSETYYVASKFERKPQVKALIHELRVRGLQILGDWTEHTVEGVESPVERDGLLRSFALEDANAVLNAGNLVLIHDDHCRGGFTELGIAIGSRWGMIGRPWRIVVIGGRDRAPVNGPIFYYLPYVEHFATVADFLADLDRRLATEER